MSVPVPLFLFLLLPILELVIFIQVGARIGVLWVLFFIFASAVVGMSIIRNHSAMSVIQAQKRMAQGQLPVQEIGQGIWLALAGVLLMLPGFITSTLGLLLLIPITRKTLGAWLFKGFASRGFVHTTVRNEKDVQDVVVVEEYRIARGDGRTETRHTIEGEFEEK